MSARDQMLDRIREALERSPGDPMAQPPAVRLAPSAPAGDPFVEFSKALTALGGRAIRAAGIAEARAHLEGMLAGRRFVASRAPILESLGLAPRFSREECVAAEVGVTSADYALADTGSLVLLTESGESRLLSLLPPRHIAVIEHDKIRLSLDELLSAVPYPGAKSSAMVIITGPSRTADIEMRLVRGVHGPGEITVVVIG